MAAHTSSTGRRRGPDPGANLPATARRANSRASEPRTVADCTPDELRALGFVRLRFGRLGWRWVHPAGDDVGAAIVAGAIASHEAERMRRTAARQEQQIADARKAQRLTVTLTGGY